MTTELMRSTKKNQIAGSDGGLSAVIWRTERTKLNEWALDLEKYHKNGQPTMGGLHDYINKLTNQEVIDYIYKELREHPEVHNLGKLNGLSVAAVQQIVVGGDGGLHDVIWRTPRPQLDQWALSLEKVHNNNQQVLGGLHDYISGMSNQDVINYINKEVKEHPEYSNLQKLNSLSSGVQSTPKLGGGLEDYIRNTPRETLNNWAIASEKYEREVKNLTLRGGIHDYVRFISTEQVVEYILKKAKEFPELNNVAKLNGLCQQYGLN